jgi:hypothetical protein
VIVDGGLRRAMSGVIGSGFFAAFLVPFVWWGFLSGDAQLMVRVITVVFGLLAVLSAGTTGLRLARVLRFGAARLRLPEFPLRPGGRAVLALEMPGELSMLERIECRLRFVEEVWEEHRRGTERTRQLVRHALWQGTSEQVVGHSRAEAGGAVPVEIEPPADRADLTTAISGEPVRYWELELRVVRAGLDYEGSFPLPVYAGAAAHVVASPPDRPVTDEVELVRS